MSSLAVRVSVALVCGYQIFVRPILPPACRFVPSCSEYYRQALVNVGFVRATGLAIARICRCHPWHVGGYDPPPAAKRQSV
jgi:putative membrane protein insertion efficiency factor